MAINGKQYQGNIEFAGVTRVENTSYGGKKRSRVLTCSHRHIEMCSDIARDLSLLYEGLRGKLN